MKIKKDQKITAAFNAALARGIDSYDSDMASDHGMGEEANHFEEFEAGVKLGAKAAKAGTGIYEVRESINDWSFYYVGTPTAIIAKINAL